MEAFRPAKWRPEVAEGPAVIGLTTVTQEQTPRPGEPTTVLDLTASAVYSSEFILRLFFIYSSFTSVSRPSQQHGPQYLCRGSAFVITSARQSRKS